MSVIYTESFSRFSRGIIPGTTAVESAGSMMAADTEYVIRMGFSAYQMVVNGPYTGGGLPGQFNTFGISADPVVASKNRFFMNKPDPVFANGYNSVYSLERMFTTPKTKYVVGFLMRFGSGAKTGTVQRAHLIAFAPPGQLKSTAATLNMGNLLPGLRPFMVSEQNVATPTPGTAFPQNPPLVGIQDVPRFYIDSLLDKNSSGKQLAMDSDSYVEIEVDTTAKTIRIWIDDFFVGNAAWVSNYENAATGFGAGFALWLGSSYSLAGDNGNACISDIYCVDMSDSVLPNTRLGSATRVVGEAPDTDVSVQFQRPAGFDSNHDVIDDPIATAAQPTNFLTGDGVGTKDLYRSANSVISQVAATVHAVTVRARYANASSAAHELAIVSSNGTTEAEASLGQVPSGSGARMSSAVLNKDPTGAAWTVANAANLQYGFKIKS